MTEFDWVTARAACSSAVMFESLKAQLREDVDKREAMREGPPFSHSFKLVTNGHKVAVIVEGPKLFDSVLFQLGDTSIDVKDKDGNLTFTATPTINNNGECRLRIKGQEFELWQMRKLALEDLLFREY